MRLYYTDGAYSSRSKLAGWACVVIADGKVFSIKNGYEPYSTNNRGELIAFLYALEQIDRRDEEAKIYTDSAYIANTFNQKWYVKWLKNGWRTSDRQHVKNQDLWKRIVSLYIKNHERVKLEVIKVEGHSDNYYNNLADQYAVKARKEAEVYEKNISANAD